MCGRFLIQILPYDFLEQFGVEAPALFGPRFNVAPTQPIATIRVTPDGQREAVMLRWGLVPSWTRELGSGPPLINARSETVAEKPSFRAAYQQRRCLIPATGFYEWLRAGKLRQPYLFQLTSEQPYAYAGLWEHWEREGVRIESCTILTTSANDLVATVHERMPVIVRPEHYDTWLRGTPQQVASLLLPYPADEMKTRPVSQAVNNATTDNESCLAPLNSA